ncbi:hypothetical protein BH09ACT7_BH09ACT7_18360 [soil metagenome]
MKSEQRKVRDGQILQLFMAGVPYRRIAEVVGLRSPQAVANVIDRELDAGGPRREVLSGDALAMFTERSEALLRSRWTRAMGGDAKAGDAALRIIELQARVHGLLTTQPQGGRTGRDRDLDDHDLDDGDGEDDLARWRRTRLA